MAVYFSQIKPVLNKLSELNVYDSLYVVYAYLQASADGNTNKEFIAGVRRPEANSVEVWFADFMIANIIKYCNDTPSKKSLREVNTRYSICNKIEELHQEISQKQIKQEVFVWLNSYIFNQFKILAKDNVLRALYRYYYLYNAPTIRAYAEQRMQLPLDTYFKMSLFVYAVFAGKGRFFVKEEYFKPKGRQLDEINEKAMGYVLNQISKTLTELKALCKSYCSYDEEKIFGFFNDAPHVKYPLIKDKGGYFCTVPSYIPTALLDGLYFRVDIPNSFEPEVKKEYSNNMENYLGLIFNHFLKKSKVKYQQEITYNVGKRKTQRTSDWILWDKTDICFMDCKTKRISVKGKQAVVVDEDTIERVIRERPFSSNRKKKEIDDIIPDGITKDLINLGIGVGKVFVSYDDYKLGNVTGFPYKEGLKFHAVIVTLDDNLSNSPGYKSRILRIAQSYRDAKSEGSETIDEKTVKMLSLKDLEECACVIANEGVGYYLDNHMNGKLMAQKYVKDNYLVDKCNDELINPFLEELTPFYD